MRTLSLLIVWVLLLLPATGCAVIHTIGPNDTLAVAWYTYGPTDTICLLPGTYQVGGPTWQWILWLTKDSPALISCGDAEDVIVMGSGVQYAFRLMDDVYDANIQIGHLTFRNLAGVIGRMSSTSSSGGTIRFTDNVVEYCGGASTPALQLTACSGTVARNVFRNSPGSAIRTYHSQAGIVDNEICSNGSGIVFQCCESPPIRRNHIHDNSGKAISTGYFIGGVIEDNVIENNGGTGISLTRSGTLRYNVVRGNGAGISLWSEAAASIHFNDVYGNAAGNLIVTCGWPTSWDCTMNWWGTTDTQVISQGIVDCYDDPGVRTCVVFEPFCDSSGCPVSTVEPRSWGCIKALYRETVKGRREPN